MRLTIQLWQQTVAELSEQLNVEGADDEEEDNGEKSDVRSLFLF